MIIISWKPGQLGNSLLLFGHFIAFASEHKISIYNPAFEDYAHLFDSTKKDFFCRFPAKTSIFLSLKGRSLFYNSTYYLTRVLVKTRLPIFTAISLEGAVFDMEKAENIKMLCENNIILAQGWKFLAHNLVEKHHKVIKDFFKPLQQNQDNINRLITYSREDSDLLIGVHIRHGDYKNFMEGKYFYQVEQYVKVMRAALNLFPSQRVKFLICSNAVIQEADFEGLQLAFGNNDMIEDLYSFAECDFLIGPPSTYTMWASFYGSVPLYQIEEVSREFNLNDFKTFSSL